MSAFQVSPECYQLGLRAGALVLCGVKIADSPPELRSEIDAEAARIREQFASPGEIRTISEMVKLREILRSVGVKPRSHPPSTQKLMEFAFKRGTLPAINNLVDAYNLVSLRSKCSLGAHDLDLIEAPVSLRLFAGDESFRPLGSQENTQVNEREFGYVDAANRVVCRLDSLQADFSKVTADTDNVLLIIEATTAHDPEQLDRTFADTLTIVERYCGAKLGKTIGWRKSASAPD